MKLILVGVGSFVVALVAATGISVMTAPSPPPAPAAADSTATSPAPHAEVQPVAATTPIEPVTAHIESTASAAHPTATTAASPANAPLIGPADSSAAASAAAGATAIAPDATPESYKSLAKILASMKPVEAAKIMAYFTDAQVEGLLRASGVRHSAVFLAQMPTERAAALARRLMKEQPKETP